MKKFLFIFIIPTLFFAKSDKLSQIPPVSEIYINLESKDCDDGCLLELFKDGLYHSFLANFINSNNSEVLTAYSIISGKNIPTQTNTDKNINVEFKIAVIIPERSIKSYTNIVSNAAIAYGIRQNDKILIKFYNIGTETQQNIQNSIKAIKDDNISYIIAPFTSIGAEILNRSLDDSQKVYIPTLNIKNIINPNPNIIFGGIDYKLQVAKLLELSNGKNAIISDGSQTTSAINDSINELSGNVEYEDKIIGAQSDLKSYINTRLNNTTLFLNLPIIKTSLLMSQFRIYDIKPATILSTQINYLPNLFKLTQSEDRQNFYIANSIVDSDEALKSINAILGEDLSYNWVAYSTELGMDFFYNQSKPNKNRIFGENIENGEVKYTTKIMKAGKFGFNEILPNEK